jgi:hypothetical protein
MTVAENKQLQTAEPNVFMSRYASKLVLHDFSGTDFSGADELLIADMLTGSPETHIAQTVIDTDFTTGYVEVTATVLAEDEASALRDLCQTVIGAFCQAEADPECVTLIAAHLVYEEQLKQDIATYKVKDIADSYQVETIATFAVDELGEQVMTNADEIFYTARDLFS